MRRHACLAPSPKWPSETATSPPPLPSPEGTEAFSGEVGARAQELQPLLVVTRAEVGSRGS